MRYLYAVFLFGALFAMRSDHGWWAAFDIFAAAYWLCMFTEHKK